jgi:hypothetical protein
MLFRPVLVAAMAATFCLAMFSPWERNEAAAQGIGNAYSIYYGQPNWSYNNAYRAYGARAYGTTSAHGYSGYGNGPYGYTRSTLSAYPPYGNYYYQSDANYGRYYRGMHFDGRSYRPAYTPNTARYYSPYYGYGGY